MRNKKNYNEDNSLMCSDFTAPCNALFYSMHDKEVMALSGFSPEKIHLDTFPTEMDYPAPLPSQKSDCTTPCNTSFYSMNDKEVMALYGDEDDMCGADTFAAQMFLEHKDYGDKDDILEADLHKLHDELVNELQVATKWGEGLQSTIRHRKHYTEDNGLMYSDGTTPWNASYYSMRDNEVMTLSGFFSERTNVDKFPVEMAYTVHLSSGKSDCAIPCNAPFYPMHGEEVMTLYGDEDGMSEVDRFAAEMILQHPDYGDENDIHKDDLHNLPDKLVNSDEDDMREVDRFAAEMILQHPDCGDENDIHKDDLHNLPEKLVNELLAETKFGEDLQKHYNWLNYSDCTALCKASYYSMHDNEVMALRDFSSENAHISC
ncbi:uncharacterized protein LOC143859234 [Tasmannia lanceolata]|uniref:uncharacterized protein LOC143859234 n=1 Tax=Tasmannia lanceolata TaxID=3420 RepID=UPI004062D1D6